MKKEINLLTATELKDYIVPEKEIKARNISIGLILVFVVIVIAVFIIASRMQKEMGEVSSKVAEKEQTIDRMREKEILYRVTKTKVNASWQLISQRPELLTVLDLLEKATPKGISFSSINIPNADKISLSATAVDSLVLDDFFKILIEQQDFKDNLAEIKLGSVSRAKTNEYKFDLLLVIKSADKKNEKS